MKDLQQKFAEWMRGRNGSDDLARCACDLAILLVVIDLFARTAWLTWLALALLAYAWFRISSKNVRQRAVENEYFMGHLGKLRPWVASPKAAFAEARSYKHVSCPDCGQKMRVPRGKGNIRVTCPACHKKFEVKS
ncbi:MAG: hypothetical protein WAY93_07280 [Atopobiaceae bacterium]|jgi:hypothetical protein|nr:hypothetical protein [Atopobiaceae bacterium]